MKSSLRLFLPLIFILSVNAQVFDWEWQNSLPTGADHNDAAVLTATKFILAGNGGSVLISTDAGNTWSRSNVDPQNRDIYSIKFVNENLGYAAGTGGLLMKTTDGGGSWSQLVSGTTSILWDVDFIDANIGFAVGSSGTILRTTDGGSNWAATAHGTTTLYKIHFINSSVGFLGSASATTGRLLKTTNGGDTWENITANITGLDGTVRGIHFIDTNTGWISNSTGKIYKTTDGGATGSAVYNIGSTTTTIYETKFINASSGYAITTAGRVLKTIDGGANWSLIQTDASKNLFGLGVLGVNSSESVNPIIIGGDAGTIIKSLDDGASWQLGFYTASQELLQRVSFPTESVGFAVGGSISTGNTFGDVLKTTNGGETWTKLPFDPGYRTYSVHFRNENLGYFGERGPNGLYKTTNGGVDWTPLNTGTGASTSIIYDIKFFDDNLGFAMYASGSVARTTDGGTTWASVSAGWGSAAGYEIFIVNASTVYICGAGGRVSKSLDGGASFFQLPSLGTATLYSLHFFDANNGYISASGGRIYKTTNGSNFTEIQLPVSTTLYTIRFVNDSIGWIGASGGDVLYTQDGGTTWTQSEKVSLGTSQSVRDISFAGSRMWLVGTDGLILRGYNDPSIPVELTAFTANVIDNKIHLYWQTATEVNNSGFEIERSNDNFSWNKIGFVPGFGTTTEIRSYSYADESAVTGKYFYRLKQLDYDGSYEYSNIVEVDLNLPLEFSLDQNYPNPFNPSTTINYSIASPSHVTLKIFNALGEEAKTLVNEVKQAGRYTVDFNASGLASGIYIYQISAIGGAGEFVSSKKLILMK